MRRGRSSSRPAPSVLYREYPLPHTIDPGFVPELQAFVAAAIDG